MWLSSSVTDCGGCEEWGGAETAVVHDAEFKSQPKQKNDVTSTNKRSSKSL